MPNIQVPAEKKREIYEAHRLWLHEMPRTDGQIGGTLGMLVEGPPVYMPGEISTYSDYEPVRFYSVDPTFVEFLKAQGIPFQEN